MAEVDVVVVGAGFAGLYQLHRLRGLGFSVQVLEAGDGVGGTWYWNRYPGARCDVQSFDYSYSFDPELEQEWRWSERYATQPEIRAYLEHVADRFDLRRDIRFSTRVEGATFDEAVDRWTVTTDDGGTWSARFVVMATGCLSVPKRPDLPGLESFRGETYLTAEWPAEGVELAGRRVGVVGTGSTGIQFVTVAAREAAELVVFQRSPNFSLPAVNRPLDEELDRSIKADYPERRRLARASRRGYLVPELHGGRSALEVDDDERRRVFEALWDNGGTGLVGAFPDVLLDEDANRTAADFVRDRIHDLVDDPHTADALSPSDHPLGTRRPCVDTGYYETFNRENVRLVDLRDEPVVEVTERGVRTGGGEYELDVLVFALGFDAVTGALLAMDVTGAGGRSLRDAWSGGPATYLGLATAGFPNLFTITGPGSPSVLSNMVVSIEQHVDWIAGLLTHAGEHGITRIEARSEAQADWTRHVAEAAEQTLYPRAAKSWYLGANVDGKPRGFLPYVGGVGPYGDICDDVASRGYEGFELRGALRARERSAVS